MRSVVDRVTPLLEEAKRLGFLGPGEVVAHIRHALAMARVPPVAPGRFVDLGSGAGVPGLVLACVWPEVEVVLVDAQARRAEFLERAVAGLGLGERTTVVGERAETAARRPDLRGHADLVVARSFGGPAVTAECAVGFLRRGGALVVSEPPDADASVRWAAPALDQLGFRFAELARIDGASFARFVTTREADDRWPRRVVVKRPLWDSRAD